VARLRFRIAMSLEGYAAGPQQSNPLGIGGDKLHQWRVKDMGGLRPVRTVAAPDVTHLRFAQRPRPSAPSR
jgi:hypothetical protein